LVLTLLESRATSPTLTDLPLVGRNDGSAFGVPADIHESGSYSGDRASAVWYSSYNTSSLARASSSETDRKVSSRKFAA
jgi:hypothetical protein